MWPQLTEKYYQKEAWPSPDKRMQERNQLITSFISLAVLLYFTFSFMLEAWGTVSETGGEDESCRPRVVCSRSPPQPAAGFTRIDLPAKQE